MPLLPCEVRLMQPNRKQIFYGAAALLIIAGAALMLLGALSPRSNAPGAPPSSVTLTPEIGVDVPLAPTSAGTATPEPLVPTPTATPVVLAESLLTVTVAPPPADVIAGSFRMPERERWRVGISLPQLATTLDPATEMHLRALRVGWVMNWWGDLPPAMPLGVRYARTVRFKYGVLMPEAHQLIDLARENPGALWLISNEADVRWQDNVDAVTYARLYHEAYTAIKAGDSSAVVAAGGIAQPSPLRLRYLDAVRAAYLEIYGAPLPMDAWHIHNYMLREERDSWGVDIPPGMPDDRGVLYEIEDSGNLELFQEQIVAFRAWMAAHGYRDLPLIISEFGIAMPEDYGFSPERVQVFLRETWRFFATATDTELGHPGDGYRLVQQWCWYGLTDTMYPTGNLIEPETGAWTHLGRAWLAIVGVPLD